MTQNVVDEYTIGLEEKDGFTSILISFKLDNGLVHGPYTMPPAYAHTFADQLTIASVRGAKKKSTPHAEAHATAPNEGESPIEQSGLEGLGDAQAISGG